MRPKGHKRPGGSSATRPNLHEQQGRVARKNTGVDARDPLFDLNGRVAVVTGASSGLGQRFARVLRERGADVVLAGRRADRLSKLAAELGEDHAEAVATAARE